MVFKPYKVFNDLLKSGYAEVRAFYGVPSAFIKVLPPSERERRLRKRLDTSILNVGKGVGFIMKGHASRVIVTSVRCLDGYEDGKAYPNLVGPRGLHPTITAQCRFIGDIAVLSKVGDDKAFTALVSQEKQPSLAVDDNVLKRADNKGVDVFLLDIPRYEITGSYDDTHDSSSITLKSYVAKYHDGRELDAISIGKKKPKAGSGLYMGYRLLVTPKGLKHIAKTFKEWHFDVPLPPYWSSETPDTVGDERWFYEGGTIKKETIEPFIEMHLAGSPIVMLNGAVIAVCAGGIGPHPRLLKKHLDF